MALRWYPRDRRYSSRRQQIALEVTDDRAEPADVGDRIVLGKPPGNLTLGGVQGPDNRSKEVQWIAVIGSWPILGCGRIGRDLQAAGKAQAMLRRPCSERVVEQTVRMS